MAPAFRDRPASPPQASSDASGIADRSPCPPTTLDQLIGTGNGATAAFQLRKTYGSAFNPWTRDIRKPVVGTVLIAVAGVVQTPGTAYTVDHATGTVTFQPGHIPLASQAITAGFEFDVPVRFDTDKLEINIQGFRHGAIPSIIGILFDYLDHPTIERYTRYVWDQAVKAATRFGAHLRQ